ncbi:MAG: molybdenum cofactor guanylyltransferase [Firmicutes bacterium]|nr:molybdenum cofactor guanylyltransferase [Bacillota bacterium]
MKAAGIILAGGKSSRFQGNKAFAELASQRLIDRIISVLKDVFPKLILVTNSPSEYQGLGVEVVSDLISGRGPLSGIHTGLVVSPCDLNLVTACDMPFVNRALAAYLVGQARPADDAVVPLVGGYPEPLFAVYRKTCLPFIEASLQEGKYKVTSFYGSVRIRYVSEEELAPFGGARSFFNINTREDLKKASRIVRPGP